MWQQNTAEGKTKPNLLFIKHACRETAGEDLNKNKLQISVN